MNKMDRKSNFESIHIIKEIITTFEPNKRYYFYKFLSDRNPCPCCLAAGFQGGYVRSVYSDLNGWINLLRQYRKSDYVTSYNRPEFDTYINNTFLESVNSPTSFDIYILILNEYKKYISKVKGVLKYLGLENIHSILRTVIELKYLDSNLKNEIYS